MRRSHLASAHTLSIILQYNLSPRPRNARHQHLPTLCLQHSLLLRRREKARASVHVATTLHHEEYAQATKSLFPRQ